MVRTKANNACTRKAVAAKAPRKSLGGGGGGVRHNFTSPSSAGRKKGKGVGGNPIRVHPTPAWQKGIDLFMGGGSSKETAASSSSSRSEENKENFPKGKGKRGVSGKERHKGEKDTAAAVIDVEEMNNDEDDREQDEETEEINEQSEEEREDEELEELKSEDEEEEVEEEEEIEEDDILEEEEEEEEEEEGGNKSMLDSLPTDLFTTQDSDNDNDS
ncbi:PREDICTED: uncharacterized protein C53C9.2-like [Amphimedon queenslandica]|uniref:PCNA-associated factor n=1 Tax=Amphimedon queenslandica TaxID=400682 RepID=A0A1X7V5X8_AMPQE|nr:PREDICTED: uncharacterized protein C53C9.2-like [Amphimedon queenslandica]|eukprot:XP_011403116.1 PREDICTED: uncharacterized protein C53C9.2-like [Amphimedon queenslandica]